MKTEAVSLDACVDESLEALRSQLEQSGAQIERQVLPKVVGDATLLTQLYQNLLSNALTFSRSGEPVVELTARQTGDVWTLGVRDNGIGLEPDYADQIFEPFKRLHGLTEYPGTGIGLAVCRKNVERHGVGFGWNRNPTKALISSSPSQTQVRNWSIMMQLGGQVRAATVLLAGRQSSGPEPHPSGARQGCDSL